MGLQVMMMMIKSDVTPIKMKKYIYAYVYTHIGVPKLSPTFAVLFPGEEVLFTCNSTAIVWAINGTILLSLLNIQGIRSVNSTTLGVNMSANATIYACAISAGGGEFIISNDGTLVLAG